MFFKFIFSFYLLQFLNNGNCNQVFAVATTKRPKIPPPPVPIVSTNVSKLYAGETISMKCEMPANYNFGNDEFKLNFAYEHHSLQFLAIYTVPGKLTLI